MTGRFSFQERRSMNTVLWILQVVLAALFAIAGVMKATQPKAKLAQRRPWAEDFSPATVRSSVSWNCWARWA
jgi:uncharacterized membrane protein YphA (DoxX/SURF4 family)